MTQEFAREIIENGINDYLLSGFEGVLLGICFSITGLILIDMCFNKKNSFIICNLKKLIDRVD